MRGKQKLSLGAAQLLRITPAHAGKTDLPRSRRSQHPDHPRACGENPRPFARSMSPSGSPPRMQGKRHPMFEFLRELRITPAHAGKTWVPAPKVGAFTDHPRACGENMPKSSVESASRGSPPRMRGKHRLERALDDMARITPAHAGKTALPPRPSGGRADHPRACGENKCLAAQSVSWRGSPPRMRGKLSSLSAPS